MAVSKQKKQEILKDLKEIIKDSKSLVFVNFHGLNVNETISVRKALKEKSVGYFVSKKTLVKKALADESIKGEMPAFDGELGIVFGKDLIEPAREIYSFQKKLDKKLTILGGIFDGSFMDKVGMTNIAQIPPLKTLHAQFVNIINSPIQGFVMALSEIAKKKS